MLKRIASIGVMLVGLVAIAAGAGDGASPADSRNLLPEIVDSRSWTIWNPSGVASEACTATPEEGSMRVEIPRKEASVRGDRGFGCTRGSVKAGTVYTLRFTAKASEPRQINMSALEAPKPGESIIGQAAIDLKPSWQTYVCRIVPTRDSTPSQTWLPYFQLGDNAGTVWFRNVTLVPAEGGAPAATPAPAPGTPAATPAPAPATPPGPRANTPPNPPGITPVSDIPDMTKEGVWRLAWRGVIGTARKEGDAIQVELTGVGERFGVPALTYLHLQFPAGKVYRLKFSAKSSAPTQIKVVAQSDEQPHDQDYSTPVALSVSGEWKEYDMTLTLAKPADAELFTLSFLLDRKVNISFRNMSLIPE